MTSYRVIKGKDGLCFMETSFEQRYCLCKNQEKDSNSFVEECLKDGAELKIKYSEKVQNHVGPWNISMCPSTIRTGILLKGGSKKCKIPDKGMSLQDCYCFIENLNFIGTDTVDCYCKISLFKEPTDPTSIVDTVHYARENCIISKANVTNDIKVTHCSIQNTPLASEKLYFGLTDTSGNISLDILCPTTKPIHDPAVFPLIISIFVLMIPILILLVIIAKDECKGKKLQKKKSVYNYTKL